ncbi:uncharacterized protein BP5553_04698 [Venustampulla echinocandica]|uniref:Uncharacterized protein n=1 Tax=Venustampulla echinocandica TaxID=2656787 RepID=A0A370TP17_9HELO|nr:uncharacterized protein BP5553_04698 [Venustampulla echinocandica]RDL37265.1 hypothetical protein BP5553_04698 [Venustampulla echinocandica]
MILGLDATVEMERPLRKKGRNNTSATKAMVYKCNCCGRKTRHSIPPAPKPHRPKPGSLKATSASAPPSAISQKTTTSSTTAASNPSSRKRPNKKQGGLKALLAKQKASQSSSSSGFGLDLMDFMSKG